MIRHNHYEAAFETFLRLHRIPYVAVDESRRSLLCDRSIKSPDFIVSPAGAASSWLVDVKGRRFPSGSRRQQYWKNWSTGDELRSLAAWEALFGANFVGALVFAYNVVGDRAPLPPERLLEHRGGLYGFVAIRLSHYLSCTRRISPRWDTVSMPAARFRELAEPADEFFEAIARGQGIASTA
jgi:hypothetical protein